MNPTFRKRLLGGDALMGTLLSLPCPAVAEVLADSGFDWLFIDGEHGSFGVRDIAGVLQAVDHRIACLVRVPGLDETPVKQALDLGADGIIVPQINTGEQAREAVAMARYAPLGRRGVGLARAHGYGQRFAEYLESANDEVTVVVQAEHIEAVANIDEIAAVEGVDAVLVGPFDLSASLGKTGQLNDPEVVSAIAAVTAACLRAGKPLGIFGIDATAVRAHRDTGYTLIAAGIDTLLLGQAAAKLRQDLGN